MSWKLSVILLTLSVIACGASLPEKSDVFPKNVSTQPATQTSTAEMTVCTDALNIRPAAGDLSRSNGQFTEGDKITVKLPAVEAGGGMWYELVDGGFVNGRYLCKIRK